MCRRARQFRRSSRRGGAGGRARRLVAVEPRPESGPHGPGPWYHGGAAGRLGRLCATLRPRGPASEKPEVATAAVVPFSEFLQRVNRNDVQSVEIDGLHLTYTLRKRASGAHKLLPQQAAASSAVAAGEERLVFTTTRPADLATPYQQMVNNVVEFGAPDRRLKYINSFTLTLLYLGITVGVLGRLSSKPGQRTGQMRGRKGLMTGSGRDRSTMVKFADVAGVDEAKEELEEIVAFLRDPDRYLKLGARPPRGILLVGPPGTGKTMLAKAVAGEAEVPFISVAASEFVELYVGMGASRVRDLFARAKRDAPAIVFIDEIDAVAKARDGRLRSVGNDEREQTLNQLLTARLDPALRRAGRFDRIVSVEVPDRKGREHILTVHLQNKKLPLGPDVDVSLVAQATSGFTGADLANLVNDAALLAGRATKSVVGKAEFDQAVERAVAGIEKKRSGMGQSEKGVVARHEVGHAVVGTAVARILPGQSRVEKLSIVPRSGGALGFTYIPPPSEERYLLFLDELKGRLVTLLGGRAAEEISFAGRISTGAADDIRRATDVAYKVVAEYGLSAALGPLSLPILSGGGLDESGGAAGQTTELVHREVGSMLHAALACAKVVLKSNLSVLEGLGRQLEEEEKLDSQELHDWLDRVNVPMELNTYLRDSNDIQLPTPD
eukprot:SM000002S05575  [mRNA]  locus=s2:941670:945782:- [translate_table: standard]